MIYSHAIRFALHCIALHCVASCCFVLRQLTLRQATTSGSWPQFAEIANLFSSLLQFLFKRRALSQLHFSFRVSAATTRAHKLGRRALPAAAICRRGSCRRRVALERHAHKLGRAFVKAAQASYKRLAALDETTDSGVAEPPGASLGLARLVSATRPFAIPSYTVCATHYLCARGGPRISVWPVFALSSARLWAARELAQELARA